VQNSSDSCGALGPEQNTVDSQLGSETVQTEVERKISFQTGADRFNSVETGRDKNLILLSGGTQSC
jgi:hypothetical protein